MKKPQSTRRLLLGIAFLFLSFSAFSQREDGIKIRFNGFGDITAGHTFGNPVSKTSDSLFKAFGEDKVPKGTHQGIGLQGLDLVNTVFLNDNFTVQSEVNLQVPRGGSSGPELDIERMYVDYKLSNKFGFQGGLLFTPIGFINRNLYSRAWLMNSVHMFRFVEEESGYVPNHFLGVTGYGVFELNDRHSVKYILGLGNARGPAPTDNIYARNYTGYQATGLLEWIIQGPKDFRIGLSGFTNEVPTYRGLDKFGASIVAADSMKIYIQETGLNPYVHYSGKLFELLAEYHYITYSGKSISNTGISALVVELALNTKVNEKRLAPYIRYDFIQTPTNNGPYVGIRDNGNGTFSKIYEPDLSIAMAGIAYDVSSFNRIKLEYARYFTGPYKQNAIVFQTAFGF